MFDVMLQPGQPQLHGFAMPCMRVAGKAAEQEEQELQHSQLSLQLSLRREVREPRAHVAKTSKGPLGWHIVGLPHPHVPEPGAQHMDVKGIG